MISTRKIAYWVGLSYLLISIFMFRNMILEIPLVLRGEAVVTADELVPFFNPHSQLLEQAEGKFNELTNGYEFRVRYAFLTTWMRYYKILPFAIVIVIPGVAYLAYLITARFLSRIFPQFDKVLIYILTAAPVLLIFLIMTYAKITHFYTLILGFSLFTIAVSLISDGLIFPQSKPYQPIILACLVTLFNPAVHYLVLFGLYMALAIGILVVLDVIHVFKNGSWRKIFIWHNWKEKFQTLRQDWKLTFTNIRFFRCIGAGVMLLVFTIIPYAAFVKFYALNGVPNLSETVPGDFYFIQDASVSIGHVLSFDLAGIMDKELTGDYLVNVPRWANIFYTFLLFIPLFLKRARQEIFNSSPLRAFATVAYTSTMFAMWATLGYSDPSWLPTFHRTMAFISMRANETQSLIGDLVTSLLATVVQVLRFPHRFQFIMLMMACILIPISLVWIFTAYLNPTRKQFQASNPKVVAFVQKHLPKLSTRKTNILFAVLVVLLFFIPLLSNHSYRMVLTSGDFHHLLTAYPVAPLKEVKEYILKLPPGKVIMLPPTESSKQVLDINGVEHKFIDKFHLYYLDSPSYYYGLTGDSANKHNFFLLLRALHYQEGWWINIARDLNIRYIVVNKELVANSIGGMEYLREMETQLPIELDRHPNYITKLFENESYMLYEFNDLPTGNRVPLYIDTTWASFLQILSRRPDLTRYYELRYSMVLGDLENYDHLIILTDNAHESMINLYQKNNQNLFFKPVGKTIAFNPNMVSSAYYFSPVFRLFQFFSDTKYNRLNMITPGLWGTITGGFIGVPQPTQFRIDATIPEDGQYRLLLRGAASMNEVVLNSGLYTEQQYILLNSEPTNLGFYDKRFVFTPQREQLDVSAYSISELASLIPSNIVVINTKYQYFDLGTIWVKKGTYPLLFDKLDSAPLLIEGLLFIPEEEYQSLDFPSNVQILPESELCCRPLIFEGELP